MPLTSTTNLLSSARQNGYAVPAFAAYTLETIRSVIETAQELQSPVIIQTTSATLDFAGLPYFAAAVKVVAQDAPIPVALHLDHGNSLELAARCLREGYTSIMIDASELPFEENIDLVSRVVQMARAVGVSVEAELGEISGTEDSLSVKHVKLTDPDAACVFVERTGIHSLAVSIGSSHGVYKTEPNLDFTRLAQIAEKVSIPIVLHGASGIPEHMIREAIRLGVSKVNIATELKVAMATTLRNYLTAHPDESDPRKYLTAVKTAVNTKVKEIIQMVGSEGRAFA